jgi:murein DD-endopeptidase
MNLNNRLLIGTAILCVLGVICYFFLIKKSMIAPIAGRVMSKFGQRTHPITGVISMHNGTDISAPIGTAVISPADGTVTTVNFHATGGKQVVVTHTNGYRTGYAHLSEQLVTAGQKVTKGQAIAKTGNTGASTGPHLHFTVTNPLGIKIDPQTIFTF